MNNNLELKKEKREELIGLIQDYHLKETGEELGHLGAEIMLDFIIEKIAPTFYNQGVTDAYKYLEEKIGDVLELQKY